MLRFERLPLFAGAGCRSFFVRFLGYFWYCLPRLPLRISENIGSKISPVCKSALDGSGALLGLPGVLPPPPVNNSGCASFLGCPKCPITADKVKAPPLRSIPLLIFAFLCVALPDGFRFASC